MSIMFILSIIFAFCHAQSTTLPETTLPDTTLPEVTTSLDPGVYAAVFPDSLPIRGTIIFTKTTDGLRMVASLSHEQGSSVSHKFHMHEELTVDGGNTYASGDEACQIAGGHYDPFNVDNATYTCDMGNKAACYRGDLSGKFGLMNLPSNFNLSDPTLSIEDLVTGVSIVIHAANQGSDRYVCSSILVKGSARDGLNTGPGSAGFLKAEANGGTVFLMTLIYIMGASFGIIAIYQIANGPVKEGDKKLKKTLSQIGRLPSTPVHKKWGVAPPPDRSPDEPFIMEDSKRDGRFASTDTTATVATSANPNVDFGAPPPGNPSRLGPSRPLPPSRPVMSAVPSSNPDLPPRPPSSNPAHHPSTVSSIGGLPPIPSKNGPPEDDLLGSFEKVDLPEKQIIMVDKEGTSFRSEGGSEMEDNGGYVDIQVKEDNLQDVNLDDGSP